MNIFKDYTYTWWQVALFKSAMLFVGIAIGAYWYKVFAPYSIWFFGIGILMGLYITYISYRA